MVDHYLSHNLPSHYLSHDLFPLLDVSAIVLANLCVAYIMTTHNDQVNEMGDGRW